MRLVVDTNVTPVQMLGNYRRLAELITARKLVQQVSRDVDDYTVLACALAANADLIVSGDDDLLELEAYQGIPIVTVRSALKRLPQR